MPELGDATPPALRFAPGPVPSPGADDHEPQPVAPPTPEDDARAALLTAAIDDPALRGAVRRAAAASLSAVRAGRAV